jgi:site-specific DNA recombinase
MRVGIYARVSTEAQEAKGTIASQLDALRARAKAEGDEIVTEFCDDGYSGARLDRPALDRLRDAAQAGVIDGLWCLSPDRLARVYALQVLILDELTRLGVVVRFVDTPDLDDPQARLLTQIQGVVGEYERAKIAERNRRGKLYRTRAGEILTWKVPYGYRRVPRGPQGPPHLVIHEEEAAVVRQVFGDYVAGGCSIRQLTGRLTETGLPSPSGQAHWNQPTVSRMLRNEAYIGRFWANRTMQVADPTRPGVTRQAAGPRRSGWRSPVR